MTKGHRLFAAAYDCVMGLSKKELDPLRQLVAGGATGRVLEVGLGTGANLAFYDWDRVDSLDAVEPDPFMMERARAKAAALKDKPITLHAAPGEALPFPDASFDTVVATLVLCTVDDPVKSLAEVKRVLKAGGSFRLLEHVRGEGLLGRFQDFVQPVYGWLAAGCHCNRRTEDSVRAAGFRLEVERDLSFSGFPAFAGVAYAT